MITFFISQTRSRGPGEMVMMGCVICQQRWPVSIPVFSSSSLDDADNQERLSLEQYFHLPDSKQQKGNAWREGDDGRIWFDGCRHNRQKNQCLKTGNPESMPQGREPIFHKIDILPQYLSRQHQGALLACNILSDSFFCIIPFKYSCAAGCACFISVFQHLFMPGRRFEGRFVFCKIFPNCFH